jgi:O-antigen/teichoic acid export membrane protein
MYSQKESEDAFFKVYLKVSGIAVLVFALLGLLLWYLDYSTGFKRGLYLDVYISILLIITFAVIGYWRWYFRKKFQVSKMTPSNKSK